MKLRRRGTELRGGLDRHNAVSLRRKPRRVDTGTCADVQDAAWNLWQEVEFGPVMLLERDSLVPGDQRRGLLGVTLGARRSERAVHRRRNLDTAELVPVRRLPDEIFVGCLCDTLKFDSTLQLLTTNILFYG